MAGKRLLVLYIAIPITLALFNGLRGSIWTPEIGPAKTFLMFAGCSLPLWLISAALAHSLLQPIQKLGGQPVVALFVSAVAAVPLSYEIVLVFINLLGHLYPGLEKAIEPDGSALVGGFWGYLSSPTGLLIIPLWLICHWLYETVTGEALFYEGYVKGSQAAAPHIDSSPVARSLVNEGFITKVRSDLGRNILALEAQEHYIKVYTDQGHDLIHYRFGDAVRELAGQPGLQVHRSYWVAKEAVAAVSPSGKGYRLTLSNGLVVPVSQSYRGVLQQHQLANPGFQVAMTAPS